MVEKINRINNPLTIVAIFAGLAEIAGSVVLVAVPYTIQQIFVWFVMGFPALLVVLFFITLNVNRSALYAPSDFNSDENYLKTLSSNRRALVEIEQAESQLNGLRADLLSTTTKDPANAVEVRDSDVVHQIEQKLEQFQQHLEGARASTNEATATILARRSRDQILAEKVLRFVTEADHPVSITETARAEGLSTDTVRRILFRLESEGRIERAETGGRSSRYRSTDS